MKIVFIGTVEFSYHCLLEVIKNNGDVVGIVTLKESKFNNDYYDLTPIADDYNIPIFYCNNVNNEETIKWIREKSPDVIFCFGLSQIIKKDLLSIAPLGVIGAHPTLLPKNRGRHPLIWALVLGLKESGLTFFFLDEGADSGPILSQKKFKINKNDNATTLYEKIKKIASIQIAKFLPKLINNNYKLIKQDDKKANYWRKRTEIDGIIDWRMNSKSILNLIKALAKPYPGAKFYYKGQAVTVLNARQITIKHFDNIEPGKIFNIIKNCPIIKCYDNFIIVTEYEPKVTFMIGEYLN